MAYNLQEKKPRKRVIVCPGPHGMHCNYYCKVHRVRRYLINLTGQGEVSMYV